MSREKISKKGPPFIGKDFDVRRSRAAYPLGYDPDEVPYKDTEIDADVEIAVRNRSGERRRTGRRFSN
jgi:hypothetical protein